MLPKPASMVALALVLGLGASGCRGTGDAAPPVGCGMVDEAALAGLLGGTLRSVPHGTLDDLRRHGGPASCTTTGEGTPVRDVVVRAFRHPRPLHLPARSCDEGWVYAGTPDRYAPACQETTPRGGRTVLLARWGQYVVRVSIDRDGRDWAGDPEIALALTEQVARRLGVPEAAQSASGSSS